MKTVLSAGLACAALALPAFATPAFAAPPSPADAAALGQLAASADAAWDARDAARMATYYAADANLLVGSAEAAQVHGREAVRAFYTRSFAGRVGVLRHVSEVKATDMLTPDLALSDVAVRVEAREADGSWKLVRRFDNVSLAVRDGGGWTLKAVRAFPAT